MISYDKSNSLGRRTFLRGAGLALALPWFESFGSSSLPSGKTPKRFVSVYHPDGVGFPSRKILHGRIGVGFPMAEKRILNSPRYWMFWNLFAVTFTIYAGLSHPAVRRVHGHSNADQYLTGADTKGHGPYKNSISLDQVYAEYIGDETRHSSLVMSTNGGIGGPRGSNSVLQPEGRPIPAMNKPKQIFDMLFTAEDKNASAKLARSKSALDLLMDDTRSLGRKLSKHDQDTLQQYLDSVRDTEVKLSKAEEWLDAPIPEVDSSGLHLEAGPSEARQYFQTMYDLIYLAF